MASMRAIVYDTFGGPDVLHLWEIALPEPGPGQVRVAIYAAGTNPVDAQNRQDGSWADLHPPVIPGCDASGVIDVVGPGVTGFAPGDEVFYMVDFLRNARGTYAEYQVVDAALIARKPQSLTHVEAAALPLAAGTAYEMITRRHGLSTTRAGTLLKQQIPIRTFEEWNEARPGFVEADLVAHCGTTIEGGYLYTLTLTDVATGWTECQPLLYAHIWLQASGTKARFGV